MVYDPLCGGLMPYMVIVKESCQICTANRYSTLKLVLKATLQIYTFFLHWKGNEM